MILELSVPFNLIARAVEWAHRGLADRTPIERIASAIVVPWPVITSTCRNFAMISSGLSRFPIVVLQLPN
jgi:hypothetical protein